MRQTMRCPSCPQAKAFDAHTRSGNSTNKIFRIPRSVAVISLHTTEEDPMRRLLALTAVLFLTSAAVPRRGAEVHLSFSGIICHVFDGQRAPRAVAMRGSGGMVERGTRHVPEASIASSAVAMSCANGDCVLDLDGVALRFLGAGRAHYDAGGSFDTIVPHLSRVTNGEKAQGDR